MNQIAFQDAYPDDLSHCYGCGKNNPQGHQLKSYWHEQGQDAETTIARFIPQSYHTAIPDFVYGGLLASLIDCHGTGSASAMAYKMRDSELGSTPAMRFVTGALNVSFKAPTPMGVELQLLGRFSEAKERKIIVDIELTANGVLCVTGQVIAIKMPATMQN
ncbi:MAG: hypothetical protein OFPI_43890 [Osedax symbiont Rs2]|nr:MAG: hypothetical protein OFPI_43890 [Osedax symbiont Rs2]